MFSKVGSACLVGMEGCRVQVEVHLARGLPSFSIVGLPDASVREARDRVVSAIRNSGFELPSKKITVNLSPANIKKEGSLFDLAIAIGILFSSEQIRPAHWPRAVWLGELALDGAIQPVRGLMPLARSLASQGLEQIIVPTANVAETERVEGIGIYAFHHLKEAVEWLQSETISEPHRPTSVWTAVPSVSTVDVSVIKGQLFAKRALEIAAAGHHHVILVGCPGTGKSLLASAFPSILPRWTYREALDATQIHSVVGALPPEGILTTMPFRRPHHSISLAALVGGGDIPMPGEISLAHRGVLFLDELAEFRRDALEALRQPLEERRVHIQRAKGRAVFDCDFLLIAAMNPCPCGYSGHPKRECRCSPLAVERYQNKVSGPLLDRIDLQVELSSLSTSELMEESETGETSAAVQTRVEAARQRQIERHHVLFDQALSNADLEGKKLRRCCALDVKTKEFLSNVVDKTGLSARAFDRIRRIARTIADLEGSESVELPHVNEAVQYRFLDRSSTRV